MPDLGDIIKGVGTFIQGAANGVIINQWQEMSSSDALNSIEEFIKNSATTQIDAMDVSLLQLAFVHPSPATRVQLIQFYAFFKIVEFHRFQKWRGFPQL